MHIYLEYLAGIVDLAKTIILVYILPSFFAIVAIFCGDDEVPVRLRRLLYKVIYFNFVLILFVIFCPSSSFSLKMLS